MSPKSSLALLFVGGALAVPVVADTIANNLTGSSAGVESATGSNWLAASFTTSSSVTLGDVILSLADTTASGGAAEVSIYSDDGLNEPGPLLATLNSVSTLAAALTPQTWYSSGLSLSANSTYWIVLAALSGEVDWSYASDDAGTGAGFTDSWAASYDSGSSWFTFASLQNAGVDPLQMDIETSAAATVPTPEPGNAALCFLASGLAALRRMNQSKKKESQCSN